MQLDVDVSPPANIITFRLGLTHLTFHPDAYDFFLVLIFKKKKKKKKKKKNSVN